MKVMREIYSLLLIKRVRDNDVYKLFKNGSKKSIV